MKTSKTCSRVKLLGYCSLLAGLVLSFTRLSSNHALAQSTDDAGVTISPPTFELSLNPGETISNVIRLENRNAYPIKIAVDKRNFTAAGEEGAIDLTDDSTGYSLSSWINIDQSEYVIPAKSNHVYTFTVTAPAKAEAGGHFGSIIFRGIPNETFTGSGAALSQEIGSLILVRVSGTTTEDAKIDSFNTLNKLYEYGPVDFDARVENLGNVHLKPRGVITITDMFGRKVGSVELDSKNVLPGAIRKMDAHWDTHFGFGRYTATLVLVFGKDSITRATVANFIIFPYRLVGGITFALIVLSILIYRSRARLGKAFKILFTGKE